MIGDSGCRIKVSDNVFQNCNDAATWPFATVAATAAAAAPDLVIHVGDYHYRENACPPGNVGCAGSPWGYGWDSWEADLFAPAAKLDPPLGDARDVQQVVDQARQVTHLAIDSGQGARRQRIGGDGA